jgi:hypothetical protein
MRPPRSPEWAPRRALRVYHRPCSTRSNSRYRRSRLSPLTTRTAQIAAGIHPTTVSCSARQHAAGKTRRRSSIASQGSSTATAIMDGNFGFGTKRRAVRYAPAYRDARDGRFGRHLYTLERMARAVGFEPTTNRLTADCSTAELRPNIVHGSGGREGAYLVAPERRVNSVKRDRYARAVIKSRRETGASIRSVCRHIAG